MTIIIDIRQPEWMTESALKERLATRLPGVEILIDIPRRKAPEVTMLATVKLYPGVVRSLPNLKMIQKLGAGVDGILRDPDLPTDVRVCRLKPDAPAMEIAEYFLAHVLARQQNMVVYQEQAARGEWVQHPPRRCDGTTVAVLGLGHIGRIVAETFRQLHYRVMGWSRTTKDIPGVECHHGEAGLDNVLGEADYVLSVLPSTPLTSGLFNSERLSRIRKGGVLLNAGRGDLVVVDDLLSVLDAGHLSGAVLDVFDQEPLARDSALWSHPKVTVTPHVAGWHLEEGLDDVAENYLRLMSGKPLLHEVDRKAGY